MDSTSNRLPANSSTGIEIPETALMFARLEDERTARDVEELQKHFGKLPPFAWKGTPHD